MKKLYIIIEEYLVWMAKKGFTPGTIQSYRYVLIHFRRFARYKPQEIVFSYPFFMAFKETSGLYEASRVLNGFAAYLFKMEIIKQPIQKPFKPLPSEFESYLDYYQRIINPCRQMILSARKCLTAFNDFLCNNKIDLKSVRIEQVDTFLAEYNGNYAKRTRAASRSNIRRFLKWVYHNKMIQKNQRKKYLYHIAKIQNQHGFPCQKKQSKQLPHTLWEEGRKQTVGLFLLHFNLLIDKFLFIQHVSTSLRQ